jgi:hypothetical protein
MIDGPAPSSVLTLASGMGEEVKRFLEAERLMVGRGPGDLLFGDALSPVVMIEGIAWLGMEPWGVEDRDDAVGRADGLTPELRSSLVIRTSGCEGEESASLWVPLIVVSSGFSFSAPSASGSLVYGSKSLSYSLLSLEELSPS